MEHSFNIDLASLYGVEEAVIIQNMFFWIRHNVANRKNYYDNRYWTYNTIEALTELFPYMNESKIYRCMKKLSEVGFILKGNYNDKPFDRTCWYAFSDKAISYLQSLGMDLFKMKNGEQQNETTIPDNKQQIINKDKKEDTNVSKKKFIFRDELIKLGVNDQIIDDWLIVRKNKKSSNTKIAYDAIVREINKSGLSANDCIKIAVERSWCGFNASWLTNIDISDYLNKDNNEESQPSKYNWQ